jgi:hypothetical protein
MSDPVVQSLVAYPGGGECYFNGHPHDVADAILNAALRSLGAETLAAQLAEARDVAISRQEAFEAMVRHNDRFVKENVALRAERDALRGALIEDADAFSQIARWLQDGARIDQGNVNGAFALARDSYVRIHDRALATPARPTDATPTEEK